VSSGALYDGDLPDNLCHADPATLRQTLERLQSLGAEVFHDGHFRSFGKARMTELMAAHARGENPPGDLVDWYAEMRRTTRAIHADQDWSGCPLV